VSRQDHQVRAQLAGVPGDARGHVALGRGMHVTVRLDTRREGGDHPVQVLLGRDRLGEMQLTKDECSVTALSYLINTPVPYSISIPAVTPATMVSGIGRFTASFRMSLAIS
jgi:hypothetical protein